MDILIHTDGLTLTDDLRIAIEDKIGRVEQFAPRAIRARVHLRKASAHASPEQFVARVHCELPGRDVTVEQAAKDPLTAVDFVAVKLERLLRKRKTERLTRREESPRIREKT
jgi:ribosomal subunit interface protein